MADDPAANVHVSSDGTISMSIGDTNKLRISLGLKPLQVSTEDVKKDQHNDTQKQLNNDDDTAEVQKRLEMAKWKRKERELRKTKSLADDDDAEDEPSSAASWVNKQKLALEKQRAADLAKALQEEEEKQQYTARDLKGLKVAHDKDSIDANEGPIILNLKDQSVLQRGDDELENALILEAEKRKWSKQNTDKKKVLYNAAESLENHSNDILQQYDDDKLEMKRSSFAIGAKEQPDQSKIDQIREKLKQTEYSLNDTKKVAADYMTAEEAKTKIKKKGKKKQLRTNKTSELLPEMPAPVVDESERNDDYGSRNSQATSLERKRQDAVKKQQDKDLAYQRAIEKAHERAKMLHQADDDEERELQQVAERARRLEEGQLKRGTNQMIVDDSDVKHENGDETMTFDATAEFANQLKQLSHEQRQAEIARQQHEQEMARLASLIKVEPVEIKQKAKPKSLRTTKSDAMDVDEDGTVAQQGAQQPATTNTSTVSALDVPIVEEPMINSSLMATIAFAQQKGMLNVRDIAGRTNDELIDPNESDALAGSQQFNVVVEHRDKHGRLLTQKQAFRDMSMAYNNKKKSWNKIEKENRKQALELKRRQMSDTDTPLNAVAQLQQLQQVSQSAAIALDDNLPSLVVEAHKQKKRKAKEAKAAEQPPTKKPKHDT